MDTRTKWSSIWNPQAAKKATLEHLKRGNIVGQTQTLRHKVAKKGWADLEALLLPLPGNFVYSRTYMTIGRPFKASCQYSSIGSSNKGLKGEEHCPKKRLAVNFPDLKYTSPQT